PRAAEHRRHDLYVGELPGLAGERVAIEDDQVGEVAGHELAAAALVPAEPGRRDGRRVQRLLDGQRLLGVPRLALVERAVDAGADAEQRIELLDRRIRAVREHGARVEQGAERV